MAGHGTQMDNLPQKGAVVNKKESLKCWVETVMTRTSGIPITEFVQTPSKPNPASLSSPRADPHGGMLRFGF
jgi:hypothetical protein